MKETEFLDCPFFEPRHRQLAQRLSGFAGGLCIDHSRTEEQCKTLVRRLVIAAGLLEAAA